MKITNKKPSNNKKIFVLIGAVILIGLLGGVAYALINHSQTTDSNAPKTAEEIDKLNQADPTYNSNKNEDTPVKDADPTDQTTDTPKKDVSVGISYAGPAGDTVEVRAFISGVIEGNGTCTATFTKGTANVSKTGKAFIDATTSQCETIIFSKSQFNQSGKWNVVVSYESADAKGSDAIEVEL